VKRALDKLERDRLPLLSGPDREAFQHRLKHSRGQADSLAERLAHWIAKDSLAWETCKDFTAREAVHPSAHEAGKGAECVGDGHERNADNSETHVRGDYGANCTQRTGVRLACSLRQAWILP
jgi:hypothetical protein